MSGDFKITMADIMTTGHCPKGVRSWFNANDLDFRKFMREGIMASEMLATGDGQGAQVVARVKARKGRSDE